MKKIIIIFLFLICLVNTNILLIGGNTFHKDSINTTNNMSNYVTLTSVSINGNTNLVNISSTNNWKIQ